MECCLLFNVVIVLTEGKIKGCHGGGGERESNLNLQWEAQGRLLPGIPDDPRIKLVSFLCETCILAGMNMDRVAQFIQKSLDIQLG